MMSNDEFQEQAGIGITVQGSFRSQYKLLRDPIWDELEQFGALGWSSRCTGSEGLL